MKTVVFITGTNCSGKTSLARALIERFGGVSREDEPEEGVVYSVMKDRRVCFAGRYAGVKYGGVDWLNGTKMLPRLAEHALKEHDVLICEGVYLNTFGPNLTKTMFQGDNRLILFLYAPAETLHKRLIHRGGASSDRNNRTKTTTSAPGCQELCAGWMPHLLLRHFRNRRGAAGYPGL